MKKQLVLFTILLLAGRTYGQNGEMLSGVVSYSDVAKVEIKIEGDASQFAHMLPNEIKSEKQLVFTKDETIYKSKEEATNLEDAMSEGGQVMKISMGVSNDILYTSLEDGKTIEQKDFMSRQFLISGEVAKPAWKITGSQKTILGYPCMEAMMEKDSIEVRAWFTSSIPVPAGPASYYGLPGLVLEVSLDGGDHLITAQSVELKSIGADDLEKPKKGKKVTREEYDQIVAEKLEEQGIEGGGGEMRFIEIRIGD